MRRPLLLVGGFLVVLALILAMGAGDPEALHGALRFGWVGLLMMIASLWQPARMRRHEAWVSDVRPPMDDSDAFAPYARAGCSCGWAGAARASAEQAFADAREHADVVDPVPERPLG